MNIRNMYTRWCKMHNWGSYWLTKYIERYPVDTKPGFPKTCSSGKIDYHEHLCMDEALESKCYECYFFCFSKSSYAFRNPIYKLREQVNVETILNLKRKYFFIL